MKSKALPPASELHRLFDYNPITGILTWNKSGSGKRADGIVGCIHRTGYQVLYLHRRWALAHRVIWKMTYGEDLPDDMEIDHVDRCRANNKIRNLRAATRSQNQRNKGIDKTNTSGTKGVYKVGNDWIAYIWMNRTTKVIGRFGSKFEADQARIEFAKEVSGEFYPAG